MPRARLISTEGSWLEAVIEVEGRRWIVMDEFSFMDAERCPRPGQEIEFEFSPELIDAESWESIFSGNPSRRMDVDHLEGWRYRAFGKVVSIKPVLVDCGLLSVEGVVHTHDPRVIGEYVAFTISRLSGIARAI